MAISNYSGLTIFDDYVNSEDIEREVMYAVKATNALFPVFSKEISLMGKPTNTYAHPIIANFSEAASHSEGDEFAATAMSTTELTGSVTTYSTEVYLTPEAEADTGIPLRQAAIRNVVDSCMTRLNNENLDEFANFTNTVGSASQDFDFLFWATVMHTWRTQAKQHGERVVILHTDAWRDLQNDLMSNNAGVFSSNFVDDTKMGQAAMQGFVGSFAGVPIYTHEGCPVGDTTGWTSGVVGLSTGGSNRCGLATVVKEDIKVKVEEPSDAWGVWCAARTRFGTMILDQALCLGAISKT